MKKERINEMLRKFRHQNGKEYGACLTPVEARYAVEVLMGKMTWCHDSKVADIKRAIKEGDGFPRWYSFIFPQETIDKIKRA